MSDRDLLHSGPEIYKGGPLEEREVSGVSREEWGALDPTESIAMDMPVLGVILSYTDKSCDSLETCTKAIRKLQKKHMIKGYPDIKYNFIVGGDGKVYEGRGWDVIPEKNKKYPRFYENSVEIGLMWRRDRFKLTEEQEKYPIMSKILLRKSHVEKIPPPELMHTVMDLIEFGIKNRFVDIDMCFYNAE